MFTRSVILFLALTCGSAMAVEDLQIEAEEFLKVHSSTEADTTWLEKWKKTAKQMQDDNSSISGDEQCADVCLIKYLVEVKKKRNGDAIKLTNEERVEVCRYYLLYKRNGWALPDSIQKYVTKENVFETAAIVPK